MIKRMFTIQNGTIISIADCSRKKADIQIVDGIITKIAENIDGAGEVIDAEGMLISTGWVDAHTHFYQHDNSLGITQECLLQNGITYAVDAGSCGIDNIDDFMSQLGGDLDTKLFINLANDGIGDGVRATELKSMDNIDEDALVAKCLAHKDQIIGIKIRIDHRFCVDSEGALQSARRVCDKTGLPLMIHASRTVIPYEVILKYFQKGDIIAHCFSRQTPCVIDEAGNIRDCIVQAKKDGIIFDMSHGATNFSFDVAKAAMAQGIEVDSISTDLHQRNINGPVHNMALTLSKMMGLGYTLEEVLHLMTVEACKTLHITDKKFEVAVGDKADLTAFVCKEEVADLTDSFGVAHTCGHRVRTKFAIKNQNTYWTE